MTGNALAKEKAEKPAHILSEEGCTAVAIRVRLHREPFSSSRA